MGYLRTPILVATAALLVLAKKEEKPSIKCSDSLKVKGHGSISIVPTGWKSSDGFSEVPVKGGNEVAPVMGGRAYWAENCTAGKYDPKTYTRSNLLGKTMRFKTDLKGAGCGCNAAFYLTSMGHNRHESECFDYYCDANNVCGQSCAEIDIMEANQYAWHSTLHTATDKDGAAAGFGGGGSGWNGPRNFTDREYGPGGKCVDTNKPFDVEVSFPVDKKGTLIAMQVTLTQKGKKCPVASRIHSYFGMEELTEALRVGMTPIISYWSDDDMLWMDGTGDDGNGPCAGDDKSKCADSVRFFDFSIEKINDEKKQEAIAKKQDKDMEKREAKKVKSWQAGDWNNQQNNDWDNQQNKNWDQQNHDNKDDNDWHHQNNNSNNNKWDQQNDWNQNNGHNGNNQWNNNDGNNWDNNNQHQGNDWNNKQDKSWKHDQGNQWDDNHGDSQNQWANNNGQNNQWDSNHNNGQGNQWDNHNDDQHKWDGNNNDGHQWDGNHQGDQNRWDGNNNDGHQWDGNHQGDQNRWDGNNNDGHQWDGNHQGDQNRWDGNNNNRQGNQWDANRKNDQGNQWDHKDDQNRSNGSQNNSNDHNSGDEVEKDGATITNFQSQDGQDKKDSGRSTGKREAAGSKGASSVITDGCECPPASGNPNDPNGFSHLMQKDDTASHRGVDSAGFHFHLASFSIGVLTALVGMAVATVAAGTARRRCATALPRRSRTATDGPTEPLPQPRMITSHSSIGLLELGGAQAHESG